MIDEGKLIRIINEDIRLMQDLMNTNTDSIAAVHYQGRAYALENVLFQIAELRFERDEDESV